MEIPVVAPEDGTVASINVAVGDAIEAGACISNIEIITARSHIRLEVKKWNI